MVRTSNRNTDTTSDKLALNKTTVLCIAYELSCIFNPDFDMLNKMSIINNVRDKGESVTKDNFDKLVDAIKNYAVYILNQIVAHTPELKRWSNAISILKNKVVLEKPGHIQNNFFPERKQDVDLSGYIQQLKKILDQLPEDSRKNCLQVLNEHYDHRELTVTY